MFQRSNNRAAARTKSKRRNTKMSWRWQQLLVGIMYGVVHVAAAPSSGSSSPTATPTDISVSILPHHCHATTTFGSNGCHRWYGVGAVSGGGATTRLLADYPAASARNVLDVLFRPNFAASLQLLKVEMGGDSYATDGSESSHMHSASASDLNFHRGYEWWLLRQARQRNPRLQTYVLPWTFPGWISEDHQNPFLHLDRICNYTLQWLKGARDVHDITIDYVGLWNEAGTSRDYLIALRKTLNEHGFDDTKLVSNDGRPEDLCPHLDVDQHYAQHVDILGFHYPNDDDDDHKIWDTCHRVANRHHMPIWSAEESSSYSDWNGAACWARVIAAHFVRHNVTANIMWNLVGSYYHGLNWYSSSQLAAVQPWCGHYQPVTPVVWATAHYTQFIPPGWYLLSGDTGASGELPHGGYYLTATSPCHAYFTVVVVKISQDHAACTRPKLGQWETREENVSLEVDIPVKTGNNRELQLWYSNLQPQTQEEEHEGSMLFQKMRNRRRRRSHDDGDQQQEEQNDNEHNYPDWSWTMNETCDETLHFSFRVQVPPGGLWTITNQPPNIVGHKGRPQQPNVQSQPQFPLPYVDDFRQNYNCTNCYVKYLADQMGAFELQHVGAPTAASERTGTSEEEEVALVQMAPELPIGWFSDSGTGPVTVIGMTEWEDICVTLSVKLPDAHTAACVAARTDQFWSRGISLCINSTVWQIGYGGPTLSNHGTYDDHHRIASADLPHGLVSVHTWFNLTLALVGNEIVEASVSNDDGTTFVIAAERNTINIRSGDSGFVALAATEYRPVQFGHIDIQKAGEYWTEPKPLDLSTSIDNEPQQWSLALRPCTPNGLTSENEEFELTSQWHIRHIRTGLCATVKLPLLEKSKQTSSRGSNSSSPSAATAASYISLTLQPCDHDSPLQRFDHDYTWIRNGRLQALTNPWYNGSLCATKDTGQVSLVLRTGHNNSNNSSCLGQTDHFFHLWSLYPNTNQVRNSFGYSDWLQGRRSQCLFAQPVYSPNKHGRVVQ